MTVPSLNRRDKRADDGSQFFRLVIGYPVTCLYYPAYPNQRVETLKFFSRRGRHDASVRQYQKDGDLATLCQFPVVRDRRREHFESSRPGP